MKISAVYITCVKSLHYWLSFSSFFINHNCKSRYKSAVALENNMLGDVLNIYISINKAAIRGMPKTTIWQSGVVLDIDFECRFETLSIIDPILMNRVLRNREFK
jgi:hypothetical protein